MNCPIETRNPEMLIAYAAGELDLETALAVEGHMASCSACRRLAKAQADVWQALDTWRAPVVSEDFDRRLYRRIEEEVHFSWWERLTRSLRPMPLRQVLPLTATAGLLLMAGLILRHPDAVTPQQPRAATVRAEQLETTLEDLDLLGQFGSTAESGRSDAM